MRTVWRFPVPLQDEAHVLKLPAGARFLAVDWRGDVPSIWALCDPSEPTIKRNVQWFPTGVDVPESAVYIGTLQHEPLVLVFHLFEVARD